MRLKYVVLIGLIAGATGWCRPAPAAGQDAAATNRYAVRADHDPNGTGKFYLGREIALVMGHEGAEWLERPERDVEEHTSKLVDALKLKAGERVADVGAGTGYFSRRLAARVAPGGRVFAVDVQPEMLKALTENAARSGVTNVVPVLGDEREVNLPADSIDVALLVDVYHEFAFPYEMMSSIRAALKPGGRAVLVEYRAEDPAVPIKAVHKMTEEQVKREMAEHSLEWVETFRELPWQHLIVFRKTGQASP